MKSVLFSICFSYSLVAAQNPLLYINEFLASNNATNQDSAGGFDDWVEIYNPNNFAVDIAGYFFSDNPALFTKYQVPGGSSQTIIPAGGFLLVWCDDESVQGPLHTNFKIDNAGEFLGFFYPDTLPVDTFTFAPQTTDISYGRNPDGGSSWMNFNIPTPQATNVPDRLYINEVMQNNTSFLQDNAGDYDPWIELYNPGNDTVFLDGFYLSDDPGDPTQFQFSVSGAPYVLPHGYSVIWCDNETSEGINHTNFRLVTTGNVIILTGPNMLRMDSVTVGPTAANKSFGCYPDGTPNFMVFVTPTPGAANTTSVNFSILMKIQQIKFWPNAASDFIRFSEPFTGEIYDYSGKRLTEIQGAMELDVYDFSNGIYLLFREDGKTGRLIVQR